MKYNSIKIYFIFFHLNILYYYNVIFMLYIILCYITNVLSLKMLYQYEHFFYITLNMKYFTQYNYINDKLTCMQICIQICTLYDNHENMYYY